MRSCAVWDVYRQKKRILEAVVFVGYQKLDWERKKVKMNSEGVVYSVLIVVVGDVQAAIERMLEMTMNVWHYIAE